MTDIPDLPSNFVINPQILVSFTSEIDPTYKGEMYETAPFGMHAIKNLHALLCF